MLIRLSLLLVVMAAAVGAAPTPGAQYVGSNVCKTCHPDIWSNFYKNPHFKSIAMAKEPPERTGCEGCHGPASEHIKKPSKATIFAFSVRPPQEILNNCLNCHEKDLNRANIRRSSHTQAEVVCNSCHQIHRNSTPKNLLAKEQRELCYNCHPAIRAQFSMPSKHRVNEGFMTCSDCHNPHGVFAATWRMASRPRMVNQGLGNEEACLKCHVEKRGPFVFEHAAVRVDGCESCHVPHGSTNSRLLKRPVTFTLCLECHNGGGNFGRTGDGVPRTPGSHNIANPRFQNCTTCHIRIHGSNADPQFLR